VGNGAPPVAPSPLPTPPDPNPPPRRQVSAYLRGDEEILPDLANAARAISDPFDLCYVPAGRVTLEYDPANYKIFDSPAFFIAKYPITNAQFQEFIDARDGYSRTHWWNFSPQATNWRMSNPDPLMTGAGPCQSANCLFPHRQGRV
jgi:hypothetical protein